MAWCVIMKQKDLSVLKDQLFIKTRQQKKNSIKNFSRHPWFRICEIVNIQNRIVYFFLPAALVKNAMVICCFDFLGPVASFSFRTKPVLGRALKSNLTLPYSICFLMNILLSILAIFWAKKRLLNRRVSLESSTSLPTIYFSLIT